MDSEHVNRRSVVLGTGAVALGAGSVALVAACSNDQSSSTASSSSTAPASSTASASGAPAKALASTNQVSVGSGIIVGDTVITQPTPGNYVGLSATCTHRGCLLNSIEDGTIRCPCHGSRFNLDGTVNKGPATAPLPPHPIVVRGTEIEAAS